MGIVGSTIAFLLVRKDECELQFTAKDV